MHRSSNQVYPWAQKSSLPYWLVSKLLTHPKCSARPQFPTSSHRHSSGASNFFWWAHNQEMVKTRLTDHLMNLRVISRRRPVLEGATITMNMPSQPKTHRWARPTRRTSRDTSENWKWCMRSQWKRSTQLSDQQCSYRTPARSKLQSSPSLTHCTNPWKTPQLPRPSLQYPPSLRLETPLSKSADETSWMYNSYESTRSSLGSTRIGFTKIQETIWMAES